MSKPPRKTVLIFLDTDKHVSPFDMLVAIDLFPDAQILQYGNVAVEDVTRIVQDAMFPRGPGGAKYTKIFIGGQDVEKALEISEIMKKSMFPPFELSVMVDPRGAYSTASAAVAKTLAASAEKGFGGFAGKTVSVLAGTGPVGMIAARLCAMEGADVVVTSRKLDRSMSVAIKINEELGVERACGVKASEPAEVGESIKSADVILAAGSAGIQLLPLSILKEYGRQCKIVGDINAVPPLGVEGLKATGDRVEVLPNVLGIGALIIGNLKLKVEGEVFKKTVESTKGIFDYKVAYEVAKTMAMAEVKKG